MSRRRNRSVDVTGRARIDSQHVRMHHWLLRSEAWRTLNPVARAALIEFYALYNGANNGQLFMSERQLAKRLNVARGTARKALDALQDRGFIVLTVPGGFSCKNRFASCWRLTEFNCDNQLATKEFMRWRSADTHSVRRAA